MENIIVIAAIIIVIILLIFRLTMVFKEAKREGDMKKFWNHIFQMTFKVVLLVIVFLFLSYFLMK